MSKKKNKEKESKEKKVQDFDYITLEMEKLHPVNGDIFILNIDTDDPDILYSEDILESVDKLASTLEELVGFKLPILVFGQEIDLTLLTRNEISSLIDKLQKFLDSYEKDAQSENTQHLTDKFN